MNEIEKLKKEYDGLREDLKGIDSIWEGNDVWPESKERYELYKRMSEIKKELGPMAGRDPLAVDFDFLEELRTL